MKKIILVVIAVGVFTALRSQKDALFTVEISTDSLLLGNYVEVIFKLENAKGESFTAPNFDEFKVVSGPSISSKYSVLNGDVSQSMSYSYQIKPDEVGNYYISPASIDVEGTVLETNPIEFLVVPNPDGIIQSPEYQSDDFWGDPFKGFDRTDPQIEPQPIPKEKTKKKRKTVKI